MLGRWRVASTRLGSCCPVIGTTAGAAADGRDKPHLHQVKRWQKQHTPPPLAGGGRGRGRTSTDRGRGMRCRLDFAAPSPSPQPPPARGGGGLFSGVALILMRMGLIPAIRRGTGAGAGAGRYGRDAPGHDGERAVPSVKINGNWTERHRGFPASQSQGATHV